MSARKAREKRAMDVKVLYTLSSLPNSTMVARLGMCVPVEVSNAPRLKRQHHGTASSPPNGWARGAEGQPGGARSPAEEMDPAPRFGSVTLKACLSAICIASPELIMDRKRDFSLYVTDPKEAYRWSLRHSIARGVGGVGHDDERQGRAAQSPNKERSGNCVPRDDRHKNFEAGKGLFSWILAEPDEGSSTVVGRIVTDAHSSNSDEIFESDDEDEEREVLEVVIRLLEMPAQSKQDYYETLRAFQPADPLRRQATSASHSSGVASSSSIRLSTRNSTPEVGTEVLGRRGDRGRARTRNVDSHASRRSSSSDADVADAESSSQSVRRRENGLATAHTKSISLLPESNSDGSASRSPNRPRQRQRRDITAQQSAASPSEASVSGAQPPLWVNIPTNQAVSGDGRKTETTDHVQPSIGHPIAQQAQLHALLQNLVASLASANGIILPSNGDAAPVSALVPSATKQADAASAAGPSAGLTSTESADAIQDAAREAFATPETLITENSSGDEPNAGRPGPENPCDESGPSRNTSAPQSSGDKSIVQEDGTRLAPAANLPTSRDSARSKDALQRERDVPLCCYNCGVTDPSIWRFVNLGEGSDQVRFPEGSETSVVKEGKRVSTWRACNACAQYYIHKDGREHRPESVVKKAMTRKGKRTTRPQKRKTSEEVTQSAGADASDGPTPGQAQTPSNAVSDAAPHSAECSAPTPSDACSPAGEEATRIHSSRQNSLSRTMSEVVERDSKRIKTEKPRRARPLIVNNYEDARLRDLLVDADGRLRTKRAIKENPEGRRPGRPKGSKTRKKSAGISAAESANSDVDAMADDRGGGESPAFDGESAKTCARSKSSPARPSAPSSGPRRQPLTSATPGRRSYAAPAHLLQSSPNTALDMLLSEGDTDWNRIGKGFTPLRRSPRKQPTGTRGGSNPYASQLLSPSGTLLQAWTAGEAGLASGPAPSITSPRHAQSMAGASEIFRAVSNGSPLTRGRLRSLRFELGEDVAAGLSSSDDQQTAELGSSDSRRRKTQPSSQTSPCSPSPASLRHSAEKVQRGAHTALGRSPSAQRRAARQARARASLVDDMGPFLGNGSPIAALGRDEDETSVGGGSPTLGAAQRRNRGKGQSPTVLEDVISDDQPDFSEFLNPDASVPPTATITSLDDSIWPRAGTLNELFASPRANETSDRVSDSLVPKDALQTSTAQGAVVTAQASRVPRKPLPATVEDAPSSSASSTPQDDDVSPSSTAETPAGLEMFEDPYGLLAMHGFGPQTSGELSADTVAKEVRTFAKEAFGAHLHQFAREGVQGVAAHVVGESVSGGAVAQLQGPVVSTVGSSEAETRPLAADAPSMTAAPHATPKKLTTTRGQKGTAAAAGSVDGGGALASPDFLNAFLGALATPKGRSPKRPTGLSPTTSALLANFDLVSPRAALRTNPGRSKPPSPGKGINIQLDAAAMRQLFPGMAPTLDAAECGHTRARLALEAPESGAGTNDIRRDEDARRESQRLSGSP